MGVQTRHAAPALDREQQSSPNRFASLASCYVAMEVAAAADGP